MSNGKLCRVSDFAPRFSRSEIPSPLHTKWKAIRPLAQALVSIALAALSWRFVGLPFRELRNTFRNRSPPVTTLVASECKDPSSPCHVLVFVGCTDFSTSSDPEHWFRKESIMTYAVFRDRDRLSQPFQPNATPGIARTTLG
jgi:hypothetical protein